MKRRRHRNNRGSPESNIYQTENYIQDILIKPLPTNLADCVQEIEILAERQGAVGSRLQELLNNPVFDFENKECLQREVWEGGSFYQSMSSIKSSCPSRLSVRFNKVLDQQYKVIELGQSSPLIMALKALQNKNIQKKIIKKWIRNLERLFFLADEDKNGTIDSEEYSKMISSLGGRMETYLSNKFEEIDVDNSGDINLEEFLTFFLLYPKFNEEMLCGALSNAPYIYESQLTYAQKGRLLIYNMMEFPGYNNFSKFVYCLDLLLTFVPLVVLCIEGIAPSYHIIWGENTYMWVISIFFAFQYTCGLLTSKSPIVFMTNFWHVADLISFVFWIVCHTMAPGSLNSMGFIVVRTLRVFKLHAIFDLRSVREDLEIYMDTLKLVYTSYGAVTKIMCWIIFFCTFLIYVFERGRWDAEKRIWIRDGDDVNDESPFANLFNCFYFTIVTMTTLGYGDISPTSYVGRVVAMMAASMGIFNLTFLINIMGECFEEIFREFVLRKGKRLDEERPLYIDKHVSRATRRLMEKQAKAASSKHKYNKAFGKCSDKMFDSDVGMSL